VERVNKGPAVAVPSMTLEQLEAFYATEYPKLVKILVVLDATIEEAEDAALEEQRSEKYRHALIAVVSIGVRAGQLGGTDAWLLSQLVSHA
jgi:hypothetical protein